MAADTEIVTEQTPRPAALWAAAGVAPELYPFRSNYLLLSGGVRLHYLDEGRGEPVVLLHGNPTWSFFYRNLVAGLSETYRAIVPDHVGCGPSDKPDDRHYEYSLRRRVQDLETLLEHLGLRDGLTLVLHDWGGMIGMAYAHRHPERVRRLVVFNTAAFRLPPGKRLPWSLWVCRNSPAGPLLVRGLNAFCRGAAYWCVRRTLEPTVRAAYLGPYNNWSNRIAILRFIQDIPLKPGDPAYDLVREVEEGLGRFSDTPMLICWGLKDFVFNQDFLEEWMRRMPHAEVHSFPDAGHFVLEDAGEAILPLVRDFFGRNSSVLNSP
jgi:haloalkane dehalogenase